MGGFDSNFAGNVVLDEEARGEETWLGVDTDEEDNEDGCAGEVVEDGAASSPSPPKIPRTRSTAPVASNRPRPSPA